MASYSLQGRTLFITGAGNGIGAETARQAAQRGAKIAVVDVDGDAAERVASSLPTAIAIEADVRDMDSIERAVRETVDAFGGIDVSFANAGVEYVGTVETLSMESVERLVDINMTGVMRTLKATTPAVVESRGYMLITASLAAYLHAPPLAHYTATKAGVEALGNAMRIELEHRGVGVGVAYFGVIDTSMAQRGFADRSIAEWRANKPKALRLEKTYPVSAAGKAVVRGMENRSRRVVCPRQIRPLMFIRQALPRMTEAVIRRNGGPDLVDAVNRNAMQDAPAEKVLVEQLSSDD